MERRMLLGIKQRTESGRRATTASRGRHQTRHGHAHVSGRRFAILNHVVNPLARRLLRSPLHGLASGRLALITYTGRHSGRRYTIPVGYRSPAAK
jgi:hypothetical protein